MVLVSLTNEMVRYFVRMDTFNYRVPVSVTNEMVWYLVRTDTSRTKSVWN